MRISLRLLGVSLWFSLFQPLTAFSSYWCELTSLTTPVVQGETAVASGTSRGDRVTLYVDGNQVGSISSNQFTNQNSWSVNFSSSSLSYGSHTVTVYVDYREPELVQCWGWDAEDNYISWWEWQDQDRTDLIATRTLVIRRPATFALCQTSFTFNGGTQGPSVVATPSEATFTTGGTLSATNAGTYTATATATGNYAGTNAALTWTINKAAQTINFFNPGSQAYGTLLTLNATATSGLEVSYSIASGPATISGNLVYFSSPGTVTVIASQSGSGNYDVAANSSQTFIVNRASQSITFANPGAQTLGGSLALTAIASSGLPVSYSATGPASITGNTISFTGTGTVAVTASQTGNTHFTAATNVVQSFAVNPTNGSGNPDGDDDGDGIPNRVELLLGTNLGSGTPPDNGNTFKVHKP